MKTFTIKIPAGIRESEKIRLIGQGKKGENGGKNGDLLIKINIEQNKKFRLEGCTLYTDLNLTPWEAALGARINIEGIDGQETVYIPQGIESGEKIRIQGKGYKDGKGDDTAVAASLYSPETGILLEMFTNEPGVQVYTGNFQGTGVSCKHGIKYPKHVSVCLESQKYPDSPNKKGWPSPYLKPGEKYYSHVAYKFSIK